MSRADILFTFGTLVAQILDWSDFIIIIFYSTSHEWSAKFFYYKNCIGKETRVPTLCVFKLFAQPDADISVTIVYYMYNMSFETLNLVNVLRKKSNSEFELLMS